MQGEAHLQLGSLVEGEETAPNTQHMPLHQPHHISLELNLFHS